MTSRSKGAVGAARAIATLPPRAYLTAMPLTRLLRFLVLLAVMLAPIGMMNTHAAMAMPAPAAASAVTDHDVARAQAGHCAEAPPVSEDEPAGGLSPTESIDCTIACSCVPGAMAQIAERALLSSEAYRPGLSALLNGLSHQAEPPPPKLS